MRWSLFLLVVTGHCSLFACHLYEYHFINENKTWDEAQSYCRKKHTDLATVFDMTDMERLRDSTEEHGDAWIGLHNEGEREWHWSLPGVEFKCSQVKWADGEPNDKSKPENWEFNEKECDGEELNDDEDENCVKTEDKKYKSDCCNERHKFICYNEKQKSNERFNLIPDEMNWLEAQNYCRQNHTDLVSGLQLEKLPDNMKSQNDLWIGLFRDRWRWSDGRNFSFRNWDLRFKDNQGNNKCAMTVSDGLKWGFDNCNEEKPFFCYKDKVILIEEEKTWTEALNHCREKHRDLVSITNLAEQTWVQEKAKNASTGFVWLGLRYTCTLDLWFWVSDEIVCYDSWASDEKTKCCDRCAAMEKGGEHKWHIQPETETFNFFCTL